MTEIVLLTGASGFLGGHTVLALLAAGYRVRGSVRNPAKIAVLKDALANAGADISRLEIVQLDLGMDDGWREAMHDVSYLIHTASPFELTMPRDKSLLVRPAVGGTERAIRAALDAGVTRMVHTSSTVAVAYGHPRSRTAPYTAHDWTNLKGSGITPYSESKTLAEQKAWSLVRQAKREDDLVVINPSGILGPLLDNDPGTSSVLISRLLDGKLKAMPRVPLSLIDVRDVAAAHVAALRAPDAGGQRFLMVESTVSFKDLAKALLDALPERQAKIPTREIPHALLRLIGLFNREIRQLVDEVHPIKRFDTQPGQELLGHSLIPVRESAVATARSLISQGIV